VVKNLQKPKGFKTGGEDIQKFKLEGKKVRKNLVSSWTWRIIIEGDDCTLTLME